MKYQNKTKKERKGKLENVKIMMQRALINPTDAQSLPNV
jgi:hypothetical protein